MNELTYTELCEKYRVNARYIGYLQDGNIVPLDKALEELGMDLDTFRRVLNEDLLTCNVVTEPGAKPIQCVFLCDINKARRFKEMPSEEELQAFFAGETQQ